MPTIRHWIRKSRALCLVSTWVGTVNMCVYALSPPPPARSSVIRCWPCTPLMCWTCPWTPMSRRTACVTRCPTARWLAVTILTYVCPQGSGPVECPVALIPVPLPVCLGSTSTCTACSLWINCLVAPLSVSFPEQCPIEWFHFACVDLTTKPKGKW